MEWHILEKYMAARPGAPVVRVGVEVGDWVQRGRQIGIVEGFYPEDDGLTDCSISVRLYPDDRRVAWHLQDVEKIEPRW